MNGLLIAEKPSLRRTLEAVYNKHKSEIPYTLTFMELRGHLLTLKEPDELSEEMKRWDDWSVLPFHPDKYGGWQYKVIEEKKTGNFLTAKERYVAIQKELSSGKYDFIVHAGDPDQEGELLVRMVLTELNNRLPVKRYWSNVTTEAEVLDALKNLRDDDHDPMLVNLSRAGYARQRLDYLVGMNLSRAASMKMGTRVACGRVKTVIQSLVCVRENEIKNFVPKTCYGVKAEYAEGFTGQLYEKTEKDENDSDESAGYVWFDTKPEAEDVICNLPTGGTVIDFQKQRTESYAPKLFKLASIQVAMNKKYGFSSDMTLSIIQGLYDRGYMSYPRTDCDYMSSTENFNALLKSASCVPSIKPYLDHIDSSAIQKVKHTKKWVNDAKLQESGHSALLPTTSCPDFDSLSDDEQKVYEAVCKRFVAIFLPPLVQNRTQMFVKMSDERIFKSTGKTLVDKGFSEIFETTFNENEIPEHVIGDYISVNEYVVAEKTSVCPRRYTDGDLIALCENPAKYLNDKRLAALGERFKIGTPATRASIIKGLIVKDQYLKKTTEGKVEYIVPSEIGMDIYDNLKGRDICKVDFTGQWEMKLEAIRQGEISPEDIDREMIEYINSNVEDIKNSNMAVISRNTTSSKVCLCPACGGDIISGPKGFYCSNYKNGCAMGSYKKICDSMITDREFEKLICGEEIVKKIRKGQKIWDQRLVYDKKEHKIVFVNSNNGNERENCNKETGYKCPCCGSEIEETYKTYKCSDSDCGFVFWKTSFGRELSAKEVDNYFRNGRTGMLNGLKGKSGKLFSADIVFNPDKKSNDLEFKQRD